MTIDNLKNHHFDEEQSHEEAVTNGRKGGIASGKTRAIKAIANKYGESAAPPNVVAELIQQDAVENALNISYDEAMILAQYQKAFKGNTRAAEFICKVKGEFNLGIDVEHTINDESAREIDDYFARRYNGGINADKTL